MSAVDTAVCVLAWAADDEPRPAPHGDLAEPGGLANPPPELVMALRRVALVTAARLRCGESPPLGLPGPLSSGTALLAAAIGARRHKAKTDLLLRAVPRPHSGWDHLTRYGLVHAAQRPTAGMDDAAAPGLNAALPSHAPLTGVLGAPGALDAMACRQVVISILAAPQGRAVLRGLLAEPCPADSIAAWRGDVFELARPTYQEFVLDTYETALTVHRHEHAIRRRAAERAWQAGGITSTVRATSQWWTALAYLERRRRHLVLGRPGLRGHDYLPGIRLHWAVAQATGGSR